MLDLNKIKLGYSPLSDRIMLYRHGKNDNHALDKREAEQDVMAVIVEYMMYKAPKGAIKKLQFGDCYYELSLKPINKDNT